MWLFIKDDRILTKIKEETSAKKEASNMNGHGVKVCHTYDILPLEDVWDLD